ncbi:MAG: hypothetical protein Fur0010_00640 [Bdellovibrio sp.]
MRLFLILLTIFNISCSSYINQMYKELDKSDKPKTAVQQDKFDLYRNKKKMVGTSNTRQLMPATKRTYTAMDNEQRRYKANDLNDNGNDGSLWSAQSAKTDYLFTHDVEKKNGDIVLIQVMGGLKNEITAELKRAFPDPVKKKPASTGKPEDPKANPASTVQAAATGNDEVTGEDGKVYDRISSVVVEEINKDHVLLRGRKNLLYKNRKRLIEVQALVAKKDITVDDVLDSEKILESTINVLR